MFNDATPGTHCTRVFEGKYYVLRACVFIYTRARMKEGGYI